MLLKLPCADAAEILKVEQMLLDTQVISASWKQHAPITDACVSSVTAKEFLEIYDRASFKHDKYYIPIISNRHFHGLNVSHGGKFTRERRPSAHLCDKLIVDFNRDYPTLVEHGSKSVSLSINQPRRGNFNWATSHLSNSLKRRVTGRYNYMVSRGVKCLAVNSGILDLSMALLYDFERTYNIKENFRNSFNDIMILSTAVHYGMPLRTEDSLLARFSAQKFGGMIAEQKTGVIIDFDSTLRRSLGRKESKGYIHRGWRVAMRKSLQL
ncbi:hypothetical protein [Pseudophaeobacter leonis]|uniref:hypothetical protein n=1 Tax=Pseudophaeobacter leonis TaxID=1144477 RepID=UPI00111C8EE3|nr:hypothetical protein [Pseudophaeobacter leonis]